MSEVILLFGLMPLRKLGLQLGCYMRTCKHPLYSQFEIRTWGFSRKPRNGRAYVYGFMLELASMGCIVSRNSRWIGTNTTYAGVVL